MAGKRQIEALGSRVDRIDRQIEEFAQWRAEVHASVPSDPSEPAIVLVDEVPDKWTAGVKASFPYGVSARKKFHRVLVGYPDHPGTWRTKCGWPFGFSAVATPAHKLPAHHKSICERCCKAERAAALAVAVSRVHEVGGTVL